MIICEFFGLPGSGKSFFCDKLKEEYKSHKIAPSLEMQKRSFIGKCIVKINFKVSKLKYRELANFLKGCLRKKVNLFAKEVAPKYMIEHICYCVSIYQKDSPKLYFLDEGVIHCLAALGAEYGLSFEVLEQMLNEIEKYIKFNKIYYLELSIENALKGIKERNRHTCYMDELDDSRLKKLLENYEINMKMFYELLSDKCIKINKDERAI